jgi:hypothetical protein
MYIFFFCLRTFVFNSFPNYELGLLVLSAGLSCLDNVLVGMCSMSEMGLCFQALDNLHFKCTSLDIEVL